ncbi:MAG: adenylate/guanylate cyclase domain-containing protein [Thermodesulfobacteriota bacterium]
MKNLNLLKIQTLRGKLIILLLLPVSLTILTGGVASFVYTRNAMLNQWNESAVLKLQRAAHDLEMRITKPINLVDLFYKTNPVGNILTSQKELVQYVAEMDGVIKAGFTYTKPVKTSSSMGMENMNMGNMTMHFHHSRILKVAAPEFDADAGHQTVKFVLSLLNPSDEVVGNLEIIMSLKYLLQDIFNLGWWQSDWACVVDKTGKYIAHTNMIMKDRNFLGGTNDPVEVSILNEMGKRPFGTIESNGHPPETVAGFYKLENIPWTIIMFAQGNKILKPIIVYRNFFAMGGVVLLMAILILIRFQGGKIVKRIKTLSEKAEKIAQGNYGDPIKIETQDEIGQLVQSYNTMVKGLKERDLIRDSFGRYVDPAFAKFLLEHPDAGKLGGKRRQVAIMMSDIRGFTALSETLSPEVIITVLNQYFSQMINIIQKHKGIIVDFFGDSILVFFEPFAGSLADTIQECLQCAKDMQKEMHVFNKKMRGQQLPELNMGIGINTGQVIVGNIGSESRAKYGIVGSAVNITSRIQAKAKAREIVISDAVYNYLKNEINIQRSFNTSMKGVDHTMTLHLIKKENR